MKLWGYVCIIILALGLAACQAPKSMHEAQVPTGFLGPEAAAKLKPGGPDQPAWIYINPKADWGSYSKMVLDPVTFWRKPGSKTDAPSLQDRQKLVNYFYGVIRASMGQYLTTVNQAGPGTLRVRVAITKAEPSVMALDVISSVMPQAVAASTIKDVFTGKPAFVGEAAIACTVRDGRTDELLAAWVADRVGGKRLDKAQLSSWGDVEQAMRFWAQNSAYRLCMLQKRGNCKAPSNK